MIRTNVTCIQDFRLYYGDPEIIQLCDDNGPFIRAYVLMDGADTVTVADFDLDGNAYVVVGSVVDCDVSGIAEAALNEINLVPNPDGTDAFATVTGVATTLPTLLGAAFHANTTHVSLRFEVASVRGTWDGTAPTVGVIPPGIGTLYHSNDYILVRVEAANALQLINNTASTGYVQVSEWMPIP